MPIIFYSTQDSAGQNIARALRAEHGFSEPHSIAEKGREFRAWASDYAELVELEARLLEADFVSDFFYSDLFVFASRHASESGRPCFTAHATGDWARRAFSTTSARALKAAFEFFNRNPFEGFEATLECTHHTPHSLRTPSLFIEVGSTEREWVNKEACALAASCVEEVARGWEQVEGRVALGFGGTHYCTDFNKLEASNYAFSHIAPKHFLEFVGEKTICEAVAATAEPVDCAVVDWKGCGSEDRARITAALEKIGLEWEKV